MDGVQISQERKSVPVEPHLESSPRIDESLRQLRVVGEIAQAFLTSTNPLEVYKLALERLTPIVGASFSCVFLREPDSDLLGIVAAYNWPEQHSGHLDEMRVKMGNGPTGRAVQDNIAIEVADIFAEDELKDWWDAARELGFSSSIAVPLSAGGNPVGALTFYFTEPQSFQEADRQLLALVADQLSATAEKAHLIEDLEKANGKLREQNEELELRCREAEEARAVKTEFLANVSHELRTPLTAIRGYTFLLEEGVHGELQKDQLASIHRIEDASSRLIDVIDSLLDLTNLKLDRVVPKPSLGDAVEMTRAIVDQIDFGTNPIEVKTELPDDRVPIHTDGLLANRILKSLLSNAVKFTEEGTITIRLTEEEPDETTDAHYRRGPDVVWTIADTGIGIEQADLEKVFEDFRQGDGSPTRRFGGTGIGLSIARGLAERLGGSVTVESVPGEGSTFTLRLPSSVVRAGS